MSAAASDEPQLNSHTRSSLEDLSLLSPLYLSSSVGLLVKILSNVVEHPDEAKYRRINAFKIAPKLRAKAGLKLLESMGFRHAAPEVIAAKGPEEEEFMTLENAPDSKKLAIYRAVIQKLQDIITNGENSLKAATTPPDGSAAASSAPSSSASSSSSSTPSNLPFPLMYPQEGELVEDDKFVFFWHSPSWPGQWTPVPFVVDGITYVGPEQYMMAQKAKLFGDHEVFAKILTNANPREHKKLGRQVKNFKEDVWDKNCVDIVVKGNLAKFTQHPAFGKRLLATKNKTLVEASPLDAIWGVGMAMSNPDIRTPSKWLGKNLLGVALMKVREILREQQAKDGVFL